MTLELTQKSTKSLTKRQENALKTRLKLIEAAEKLIRQKGFNKLSVDDITQECKVAKGTFYVHFRHKEDIVFEICKNTFQRVEKKLNLPKDATIVEKLTRVFNLYMSEIENYGINICREWIKGVVEYSEHSDNMGKIKLDYDFETFGNIIKQAIQNKELENSTPIDTLTYLLISEMYGLMNMWCMSGGDFRMIEWSKKFSKIQISSILDEYLV